MNVVGPAGLVKACSWLPSPPSFKVQFGATAGTLAAVVCKSTMVLLQLEQPAVDATRPTLKTSLREACRVELGGSASALDMRLLGDAQVGAGG